MLIVARGHFLRVDLYAKRYEAQTSPLDNFWVSGGRPPVIAELGVFDGLLDGQRDQLLNARAVLLRLSANVERTL